MKWLKEFQKNNAHTIDADCDCQGMYKNCGDIYVNEIDIIKRDLHLLARARKEIKALCAKCAEGFVSGIPKDHDACDTCKMRIILKLLGGRK